MKICRICNKEKELTEFHKRNIRLYRTECKECVSEIKKKYFIENREIILVKKKEYTKSHKEEKKGYDVNRRKNNMKYERDRMKIWKKKNKHQVVWRSILRRYLEMIN